MRKHIVPEGPEGKDQVHIETQVHMSDLIRSIEVRDFLGVGSLVGKLRPHRPHGKKEKEKKIETLNRSHIVTNLIKTKKRERRREMHGSYKTVEQPLQKTEAKKVQVEFYHYPPLESFNMQVNNDHYRYTNAERLHHQQTHHTRNAKGIL